jgi:anti-sigma regulatory factor (Ser/Thr protein kinase)
MRGRRRIGGAQARPVPGSTDGERLPLDVSPMAVDHAAYWEFVPEVGAVSRARALAREALLGWDLADSADDGVLMVSELVSNAYLYGGNAPITVSLRVVRSAGLLVCAVGDGSVHPPRLHAADGSSDGGRGLALVAALSGVWGWYRRGAGKDVWFALLIGRRANALQEQGPDLARESGLKREVPQEEAGRSA